MVFLLFVWVLLLVLITSIISLMGSSAWITVWFSLELNTLSFLFLLLTVSSDVNQAMKYFLIQTITTLLLIVSILLSTLSILPIILMMKMGLLPFHLWVLDLIKEMNWITIFTLLTIQKLPLFYILKHSYHFIPLYYLFGIFFFLSATLILMTSEISVLTILLYSSISHSYWMFLMLQSTSVFMFYFMIYMSFLLMILYKFRTGYMPSYSISSNNFFTISLWGLGGFPPFTLFILKWWIISVLSNYHLLLFILLMLMVWSFSIYYRIMWVMWMNKYMLIENMQIMHSLGSVLLTLTYIPFIVVLL